MELEYETVGWKDKFPLYVQVGVARLHNLVRLSKRDAFHLIQNALQDPTPPSCQINHNVQIAAENPLIV